MPFCSGQRFGALAVAALALTSAASGAGLVPAGPEFIANTYTVGEQLRGRVGVAGDGSFVVVWDSNGESGGSEDVFARRYDSSGVAQGSAFQVNSATAGSQNDAQVAVGADGRFVVAFVSGNGGPYYFDVFARRFDSSGMAQGLEVLVNSFTLDSQAAPGVAMSGSGGFVVVWHSYRQANSGFGVFGQLFDSNGAPQGLEFQVVLESPNDQKAPRVAMSPSGQFVVVWNSVDESSSGIYGRRFDSAAQALSGEFRVNEYITGIQYNPRVAIDADGGFVVVWNSEPQDDSLGGSFGRRFNSSGDAVGADFQIAVATLGLQIYPAVAQSSSGEFVVAWTEYAPTDDFEVLARRFSANGPLGAPFVVNKTHAGTQQTPEIAAGAGRFVVVWRSIDQDGDGSGVFGQRLESVLTMDIDGNGAVEPLEDGMLFLRYSFGFRGDVLIDDAVGGGCTRCLAPEIELYIEGL